MKTKLDEAEYGRLIARLEFHDNTRNTLLTFSFTTVITILGVALPMSLNELSVLLCLMPYLLIIPFSARITYYRISSAHVSSFLRVYAPDKCQFELGAKVVKEGSGAAYNFIAFLVNHEMFILGLSANIVFYFKCFQCITVWKLHNYLCIALSIVLLLIAYILSHCAYSYTTLINKNMEQWSKLKNEQEHVAY